MNKNIYKFSQMFELDTNNSLPISIQFCDLNIL